MAGGLRLNDEEVAELEALKVTNQRRIAGVLSRGIPIDANGLYVVRLLEAVLGPTGTTRVQYEYHREVDRLLDDTERQIETAQRTALLMQPKI